ncbi:MAG: cytochrome P450 [Rhizobiaceae bacterium]|nr:cytochrome P450 [Rhizobiaceae bacterium]MCV0404915.1 cytochrome P450 [Rhizobiaceae bacterium]
MNEIEQPTPSASACPARSGRVSPFYHETIFDELADARAGEPVFYSPETDCWVVTRYDDVMAILHDHARFSSENTSDSATPVHQDALDIMKRGGFSAEKVQSNCDGERHTRVRNVSAQMLNVRTFALLEPKIRDLVTGALDRLEGRGEADLLADLTYELPAQVLFLFLGIPKEDTEKVKAWSGTRTILNFSPSTYDQQVAGAQDMVDYWRYCVDLVAERMANPGDDVVSGLLRVRKGDDSVITLNELTTVVYGLVFAGHETTTSQLTNTFRALLTWRENWEAICADPSLIPFAVEEAFRYFGAVIGWRRRALEDVVLGGVTVPKGGQILLSFASANRDEAHFDAPERFDVRRKNARKHLTMGNGKHVCLGAPLARLEMKIVLEEFTRRFPNVRLKPGAEIKHAYTYVFNAPKSLPVILR